eukprot:g609.t1
MSFGRLEQMISDRLSPREGAHMYILCSGQKLDLWKALKLQDLQHLSYVFVPLNLIDAWRFLHGLPVPDEEHVLEGVTRIEGLDSLEQLRALPSTLREATLASDFDQSLESVSLPDQLQLLRFGNEFNQSLQRWKFPEELQKLVMGNDFNQTLEQVSLPQRLQVLELGDDFDQSLQKFGSAFDQSLDHFNWPSGLKKLDLGFAFNRSLEKVLWPESLQNLIFGHCFNQKLTTCPPHLHSLELGDCFDQAWSSSFLPSSLQSLVLGSSCRFEAVSSLPGLQEMEISPSLDALRQLKWPSTLTTLTFGRVFDQKLEGITLPETLKSLTFGFAFNQSLRDVILPTGLERLEFGSAFIQSLEKISWPKSLKSLILGSCFNQSLEDLALPNSLESLHLGFRFNRSLEKVIWPSNLQSLTFGTCFNQPLEHVIFPSQLQSLKFGTSFNQSLVAVTFPCSLWSLAFGNEFNQSLLGVTWPSNLHSLEFGEDFDQDLQEVTWPEHLQLLVLGESVDVHCLDDLGGVGSTGRPTVDTQGRREAAGVIALLGVGASLFALTTAATGTYDVEFLVAVGFLLPSFARTIMSFVKFVRQVHQLRPSNGLPQFFPKDSNLGGLQELQLRFGNETSVNMQEMAMCNGQVQTSCRRATRRWNSGFSMLSKHRISTLRFGGESFERLPWQSKSTAPPRPVRLQHGSSKSKSRPFERFKTSLASEPRLPTPYPPRLSGVLGTKPDPTSGWGSRRPVVHPPFEPRCLAA